MQKQNIEIIRLLCFLLIFLIGIVFAMPDLSGIAVASDVESTNMAEKLPHFDSETRFENYSADDIRQHINAGGQVYKYLRVHSLEGLDVYQVPISNHDIERLLVLQEFDIHSSGNQNPFPWTRIRNSGLPHEESIVIVLMGDAFTASQYGTWPNPAQGTALYHADNVINTMFETHPFGLFKHLLTVYVIHSTGLNQVPGINGYLGTVDAQGRLIHGVAREYRIAELASALVEDPSHIDMIQVISNSITINGFAFFYPPPLFPVNIAVASIIRDGGNDPRFPGKPPGGICICTQFPNCNEIPSGTLWHNIFIHEFGHSFGILVDERGDVSRQGREWRANSTAEPYDSNLKWQHWFGYRRVSHNPIRFGVWAVPAAGIGGCLMRGGAIGSGCISREFCGVCTAELVRRMAIVSGEPFYGRSPITNPQPPHTLFPNATPTVTIPSCATRILDSAFHGNTSVQTIGIPSTVTTIGDYAFLGATNLSRIVNFSRTPQTVNDTTFAGVDRGVVVVIPHGTTSAYSNAGWHTRAGIVNMRLVEQFRTVNSWEGLRAAINAAPANIPTGIAISASFSAPTGTVGDAIVIPADRDITLLRNATTGMRLVTQLNVGQRHFIVYGNLTLEDEIRLCGNNTNVASGGVFVGPGGTLTMNTGSLIQLNQSRFGGAVQLHGTGTGPLTRATFNMNGGVIRWSRASLGGAVDIFGNSRMNMHGGNILINDAVSGGGVWVEGRVSNGQGLNMTGGTILTNVATHTGGGIYSFDGDPANVSFGSSAFLTSNTPNNTNISGGLFGNYGIECYYTVMQDRQMILERYDIPTDYCVARALVNAGVYPSIYEALASHFTFDNDCKFAYACEDNAYTFVIETDEYNEANE